MEQKAHTHLSQSEGKNQSRKVENEVFEMLGLLFDLHVVEGQRVRSTIVISEVCFRVSQLFGVNELKILSPHVVKCNKICFVDSILILKAKDPHISEVNDVSRTIRIFLLDLDIFEVVVNGKANLTD